MKRFRALIIALLLGLAVILGFGMENLKVNINYMLERGARIPGFFNQDSATKKLWLESKKIDAPYDYYHNHKVIDGLYEFTSQSLVRLKWFNSFLFTAIFMLINAFLMKLITGSRTYFKWTIWLYTLFFAISFAVYAGGRLTGTLDQAYGVSRKIVGGLQSLVPLMILLPASWLLKSNVQIETT